MELLKKSNTTPNFYCSEEFMKRSKFEEKIQDDLIYWESDNWIIAPPINNETGTPIEDNPPDWMIRVWSDFNDWEMNCDSKGEFLDHEFIFDPNNFLQMVGGDWQVFRKNCRKFPRRFQNGGLNYGVITPLYNKKGPKIINDKLENLLINWLTGMGNKEIFDDEIILDYLLHGENRKILFTNKGDIYGINIWDVNHCFINYRFCICKQEAFLSEYLRFLFYTDPDILSRKKLVNDGGSVGNPQLEKFKRKMNPIRVRNVMSWTKLEIL